MAGETQEIEAKDGETILIRPPLDDKEDMPTVQVTYYASEGCVYLEAFGQIEGVPLVISRMQLEGKELQVKVEDRW